MLEWNDGVMLVNSAFIHSIFARFLFLLGSQEESPLENEWLP